MLHQTLPVSSLFSPFFSRRKTSRQKIQIFLCLTVLRYRPDDDEMLVDAGEKILAEGIGQSRGKREEERKRRGKG